MDAHSLENWKKVKAVLEEAGKTDTMYYRRACLILEGRRDPLDTPFEKKPRE